MPDPTPPPDPQLGQEWSDIVLEADLLYWELPVTAEEAIDWTRRAWSLLYRLRKFAIRQRGVGVAPPVGVATKGRPVGGS